MPELSNRLPVLAAEIKCAHAGLLDAAKTAAERAIEAGHALIEAKSLLGHGEWLPWLKEHCDLPERTAQLYMKIAGSGLESATVADIGLKAAARSEYVIHDPGYNPVANCDGGAQREWLLFRLFLSRKWRFSVDGASAHVEYLLQKQFLSPDDWLGKNGADWRKTCRLKEPDEFFKAAWTAFVDEHRSFDLAGAFAEIEADFLKEPKKQGARKRRRHRR